MIITKFRKFIVTTALLLGLAFVFVPKTGLLAVTSADCDPWPEETAKISECIQYYIDNPQAKTYEPGTDPNNPSVLPFAGVWGIGAAYSGKIDQVLVVSSEAVTGSEYTHIMGIMADPKTLAPKGSAFQIDQGKNMFRGKPQAIYNPDNDKFFVAWEDSRPTGNSYSVYSRILSGAGQPEGKEIPVNLGFSFLSDVAYDSVNHKYVVMLEPGYPQIRTIDLEGNVEARSITIANDPNLYEGQGNLAINTTLNEYWTVYVTAKETATTDDERVMFQRINAKTGEKIGDPVLLSTVRLGHNAFADSRIEYDPINHTAVAVWLERGRDGVAGVWGRSINDDGTLGAEFPVITQTTFPYSEGYGVSTLSYNPWTGTFVMSSGDWAGGAESVEFDYTGTVYKIDQAIAASCTSKTCGTFNLVSAPASTSNVFFGSLNYAKVGGTRQNAVGSLPAPAPTPNPPPAPTVINIGSIGVAVNQIYIWSLAAASILALLMIVVGGYITLTAAGNAQRASKGKTYITSSIAGLVLLFGAYLLLNTINPDLVNFRNPISTDQAK